jgi:hypothetical protein
LVHVPIVNGRDMHSIIDYLNGLYVEFIGLCFRLFYPKADDPIMSIPEIPEEPLPDESLDLPNMGAYGLTITDGWD